MLKRKNEEDNNDEQQKSAIKRVALDAEAIEAHDGGDEVLGNQDHEMITDGNDKDKDQESKNEKDDAASRTISSHKVQNNDDPTYVHFRMLCQVKEAALVVGKGGEKINHIKETSGTRINVSENIRGVTERVIHVRGPAENVAKAFGLMTRAILDEEEGVPSTADSKQLNLRLLIPHQVIGYVIGKQGIRFREIEDNSAAKLSASSNSMPFSTDRCLTIAGVADSIHIATYYVAQTVLEHKSLFKGKVIFYDPAQQQQHQQQTQQALPANPLLFNGMMNYGQMPQFDQHQLLQFNNFNRAQRSNNNNKFQNRMSFPAMNNMPMNGVPMNGVPMNPPISLPLGSAQITQDIFIPDEYVGNIIGKSGKNIKQIKDTSRSRIQIADAQPGAKERKITLVGTSAGNQTAIFLINNKIETDKRSNEAKAQQQQQQQQQSHTPAPESESTNGK